MGKILLVLLLIFPVSFTSVRGQSKIDSTYIEYDEEVMVTRFYFSRKFTDFKIPQEGVTYQPNTGLNTGIGFTYQRFTLNIGVPLPFLNPTRQRDFPRFLDLQGHFYPVNWMVDFFGQFYKGYQIPDFQERGEPYLRKDLGLFKVGAHVNYIFSGEKISINAAMHQSEIQKKSAISPLIGFEIYRMGVSADSLIVPQVLDPLSNFSEADYFHLGPNAGLIGTVVFGKGFFATGAISGNIGAGNSWIRDANDEKVGDWSVVFGYHFRGYLGYNSPRWGFNVNYVHKDLNLNPIGGLEQSAETGNYRLNFVYKIRPGKKFAATYRKFNPTRILKK